MNPLSESVFIHLCRQLHATSSKHPLTSIVTPLTDIITAIDLHLFRSPLLSPSLFLWIVSSGALLITWIGNWTIKTHTIFSIVKSGNQTRHTYLFNIKGSRCYYYHRHHHRYHNDQLTAVSFVGTVATAVSAVTHPLLGDTFPVCALPVGFGALPFDWTTNKLIVFNVTCKHFHHHCIRLSSSPYTSVFTAFVFLIAFIHPPFSSRSLTLRISFIHSYRQLHATLLSHPLTSIGTPHIDIITSIDHHFFRSLLLLPPLPLNMPVRGLYGHVKGSYGHGLAHTLPVPAL